MMEVDHSPPNTMDEINDGQNSNSTPGSDKVTTCGSPTEDLWLEFKCVFCTEDLKNINNPKLLPCLHTACEACLSPGSNNSPSGTPSSTTDYILKFDGRSKRGAKNVSSRGRNKRGGRNSIISYQGATKHLSCPACSQEINIDEVVKHMFLDEYLQNSENLPEEQTYPCTSCEEGAEGTGYCEECREWLCPTCVSAHHRVRVTKDHTVRSKEEMEGENVSGRNQKFIKCPTHILEELKLYCETCEKLTCRDCQLSMDHKDHKYQFLTKACEEEKGHINELLSKIKEKQNHIEGASSNLNKRHEEILDREKNLTQEIKTFAVKFITDINKRGKTLLQDLEKVCTEKKTQVNLKNEELRAVAERLKHCQKFAQAAVHLGSDTALVYSKKPIMTQLRRILRHRCEVPNPNNGVNIVFNYESSFLTQYITSLGQILVDQQPLPGASANHNAMLPLPASLARSPVPTPPQQPIRQQPMQNIQMNQQRIPQQQMNQHHTMPMAQHNMVNFNQSQVTSSTDPSRNHNNPAPQMRQQVVNKQMQYTRMPHQPQQRSNMQQSPQVRQQNQQVNYNMQQQANTNFHQQQQRQQQLQQQQQQRLQQQQQQLQQQQQIQQQQIQQQQQQQQQPPPTYNSTPALPMALRQNNSISVTTLPSPGPSPSKQRAIAPRNVNNQTSTQRQSNTPQRPAAPQVIVLDDQPNKTPTMSNTNRLSHFPTIAATIAAHPGLQIQPTNNKYTSLQSPVQLISTVPCSSNSPSQNPILSSALSTGISEMPSQNPILSSALSAGLSATPQLVSMIAHANPLGPPPPYSQHMLVTPSVSLTVTSSAPSSLGISNTTNSKGSSCLSQLLMAKSVPSGIITTTASTVPSSPHPSSPNPYSSMPSTAPATPTVCPSPLTIPILQSMSMDTSLPLTVPNTPAQSTSTPNTPAHSSSTPNTPGDNSLSLNIPNWFQTTEQAANDASSTMPTTFTNALDSSYLKQFLSKDDLKSTENDKGSDSDSSDCSLPSLRSLLNTAKSATTSTSTRNGTSTQPTLTKDDTTLTKNIVATKTASQDSSSSIAATSQGTEASLSHSFEYGCRTDPNDDICAVCRDGGHVACCSFCPRVYHYSCHIPAIPANHDREMEWRCRMCSDISNEEIPNKRKSNDLQGKELIYCERILLEVMCHPGGTIFHTRVSKTVTNYYKIIKKPMEFETIKTKMNPLNFEHYKNVESFIDDMILLLKNCYTFNEKNSQYFINGETIEMFFRELLEKYLPEYLSCFTEDIFADLKK